MSARDAVLATLVAVIWGLAFVATRLGLDELTPPELTALRFAVAALAALVVAPPRLAWTRLVVIGLFLFTGQFLLQFFGIAAGVPPGLAAVTVQTQALFTVLFALVALGERPSRVQLGGMAVALAGLGLIGLTVGHDLPAEGLVLTLLAAASWGVGNVMVKRVGDVDMLALMVWLCLVPPLPALALSLALDGAGALPRALARASPVGLGAALYLGAVATVVAYAIWGRLLRHYTTATVAPFALLVPCVGAISSRIVFGERFGGLRLAGTALVVAGVGVVALSTRRARAMPAATAGVRPLAEGP
jgi:O-acetylserine/cysteine efflux transporter